MLQYTPPPVHDVPTLIAQAIKDHQYYCSVLEAFVREYHTMMRNHAEMRYSWLGPGAFASMNGWKIAPHVPSARFVARVPRRRNCPCAWYSVKRHECVYLVPYMIGNEFESTVAHECCHAYQRLLDPKCKWHGELFWFMLRNVCGFQNVQKGHGYDVKKARALSELLMLKLQLESGPESSTMDGTILHWKGHEQCSP